MAIKERKAKYNQTIVKVYDRGDGKAAKIKVIQMAYLRTSGIEDGSHYEPAAPSGNVFFLSADEVANLENDPQRNDTKLDNNVARARTMIFDKAYCNPWQYFFTGTIDGEKHDREDLENIMRKFSQWVRDLRRRKSIDISYLLIPELHRDGKSWHLHGFIHGLPETELHKFRIGDTMGKHIARKVKKGEPVYNWPAYAKKFGFCSLEPVKNHEACAKYITKYITKELSRSVSKIGAHMYYCTKGLRVPQKVLQGSFAGTIKPDYEGDYCSVLFTDYDSDFMQYLCDNMHEVGYSVCVNENPKIEPKLKAKWGFTKLHRDYFQLPQQWTKQGVLNYERLQE